MPTAVGIDFSDLVPGFGRCRIAAFRHLRFAPAEYGQNEILARGVELLGRLQNHLGQVPRIDVHGPAWQPATGHRNAGGWVPISNHAQFQMAEQIG